MFCFGTRPEAIKLAPVIKEAKAHSELLETRVVVTGQHREMLDQVLKIFNVRPDHDLRIMEEGQSVESVLLNAVKGLKDILAKEKPDMMIVQGDTTTTFASSLSAFYQKISVGHVEAGLRTWDKYRPFPEEMNRRLTSVLADIHFAPTQASVNNLKNEGIDEGSIYLTGNTVIDALFDVANRSYDISKLGIKILKDERVILVTTHRRESFGAPLNAICNAIKEIAKAHPKDVRVVIPVHKNPVVKKAVKEILGSIPNVSLIEPLEYEPFVHLMKASYLILTDSGGVQEEAPSLGKPVLVLREVTERPEGIEAGVVKLVGTDQAKIKEEAEKLLKDKVEYDRMALSKNPYGDGKASKRIVDALIKYFGD